MKILALSTPTLVGVLVAAILSSGCGASPLRPLPPKGPGTVGASQRKPAPLGAKPGAAGAKTANVKVQLAFLVEGWADPYILAKEDGYYRQTGINATIVQGNGSVVATQVVANGGAQFGVMEAGTVATLISKGLPVKVLAVFIPQTPEAFIHDPGVDIRTPRDLIGHPVIASPGGAQMQILPAVLGRYGVTMNQLHFDLVNPRVQVQSFMKTKGAVLLGPTTGIYPAVLKVDPKAVANVWSRYGIHMYNSCLITNLTEIKEHPALVRRFVAASVKGWRAAVRNPAAAANAAVKEFPKANHFIQLAGTQQVAKLVDAGRTNGHPLGWMSMSGWRQTLALLHRYGGMKSVRPVRDYYTNAFLPKS